MTTTVNGYEIEHYHRCGDDGDCTVDCCDEESCLPAEPSCAADKHGWTREGMGGCAETPGVWSVGGTSYAYSERCIHCGTVMQVVQRGMQRNPYQCDTAKYEDTPESEEVDRG
jgi:hypothetical protein